MTDPQQQFPAPPPSPSGALHGPGAATGAPAYGAGYGSGYDPGAVPLPPARVTRGNGPATTAFILAVTGFALELLRYVGVTLVYAVSSSADPLPQPLSMTVDVVLFLLYAAAVVLAVVGLVGARRTGRMRAGVALGLGVSGAAYLILQFVFSFVR